jgi:hypothetical protein
MSSWFKVRAQGNRRLAKMAKSWGHEGWFPPWFYLHLDNKDIR